MKRASFVSGFVVLFAAMMVFMMLPGAASADMANATQINLEQTVTGQNTDYDGDFYKFTIPSDGKVKLSVRQQSGVYWTASILHESGNVFRYFTTDSSSKATGVASVGVGLPKGTYYISIRGYNFTQPYEFTVGFTAGSTYEKEFNNTIANANPVGLNTSYKGAIQGYYDEDFFRFTIPTNGNVSFNMNNVTGANWFASVMDVNGMEVQSFRTEGSTNAVGMMSAEVGLPAGTYYLKIKDAGYNTSDKEYQFKVNFTSSEFYEKEFNNSLAAANQIILNKTYKGVIADSSDEDFYKVQLSASGNVKLAIKQKPGSSWNGYILHSNGGVLEYVSTDSGSFATGNKVSEVGLAAGTYYIKIVNGGSSVDVPYEFSVQYTSGNYFEKEFNNTVLTANPINLNATYYGALQTYRDYEDFYSFSVPVSGNVYLTAKQLSGSYWYYDILDSKGTKVMNFSTNGGSTAPSYATKAINLPAGKYFVKISGVFTNGIQYNFKVHAVGGVSGLKASPSSYNSVKLSWSAAQGATGYEVYRAVSQNGTYTKVGTATGPSFVNSGLATGTTYYYKVRAYRGTTTKVYGDYSSVVSVKPVLPTPAVKAVSGGYNSIKLSWGAVSGASGYEIQRATTQNGTYTKVGTVTGTSFANTGLATGTTYYYKVRAYRGTTTKVYGGYSSVVSAKPALSTPAVKAASSGYNSVKLSWGAVTGASGYEVYRATSSTGTYSRVATTTSGSFSNSGLTTNKAYYYKVRAYRIVGSTKVYGTYSTVVSAKPVPAVPVNFKAARVSSTSIKTTWSAVAGASGYEVHRATSLKGTYSLVKTVTTTTFTNTGLTKGKVYYYKVRAYRVVGGVKVYSGWTGVLGVK
ncbi:fibronectin type III domain-containing protein [Neobacillus notoginsengisoli]|nr:fibronectin type III domain-containing protein [Neobacillus notoginsengisoli]